MTRKKRLNKLIRNSRTFETMQNEIKNSKFVKRRKHVTSTYRWMDGWMDGPKKTNIKQQAAIEISSEKIFKLRSNARTETVGKGEPKSK